MEKTTGVTPELLKNVPKIPEGMRYLVDWYYELQSSEPLNYREIQAWSEVTGKHIKPWEAELLASIDRILWRIINA